MLFTASGEPCWRSYTNRANLLFLASMPRQRTILSIAPYKILPPTTGGQMAITQLHNALAGICRDIVVSTDNNDEDAAHEFAFHKIFKNKSSRYIPYTGYSIMKDIVRENRAEAIICEHPYMALTALRLSQQLKIPWFMRSHNIESQRFKGLGKSWWQVLEWYEQYGMMKANGVFFITPEDAKWAAKHFAIQPDRCHVIPFGTPLHDAPKPAQTLKTSARKALGIEDDNIPVLYFLGALDYAPNADAVAFILDEIIPRLNAYNKPYRILVAGKGLAPALQKKVETTGNIQYTGFIDNLDNFLNACDIMLNPVLTGGGIKTKAIEALAYNKHVISTQSGAAGIIPTACGDNLYLAEDGDWDTFTENIIAAMDIQPAVPASFYDTYNSENIARKVLSIIETSISSQYR